MSMKSHAPVAGLWLAIVIAFISLPSRSIHASGAYTHVHMAEESLLFITNPEIRVILSDSDRLELFKFAALFPDSWGGDRGDEMLVDWTTGLACEPEGGNCVKGFEANGEILHDISFLNQYARAIKNECSPELTQPWGHYCQFGPWVACEPFTLGNCNVPGSDVCTQDLAFCNRPISPGDTVGCSGFENICSDRGVCTSNFTTPCATLNILCADGSPCVDNYGFCFENRISNKCERLLTHFMGALAHIVADTNFDHFFVRSVNEQCHLPYPPSTPSADGYTDQELDGYLGRFGSAISRTQPGVTGIGPLYDFFPTSTTHARFAVEDTFLEEKVLGQVLVHDREDELSSLLDKQWALVRMKVDEEGRIFDGLLCSQQPENNQPDGRVCDERDDQLNVVACTGDGRDECEGWPINGCEELPTRTCEPFASSCEVPGQCQQDPSRECRDDDGCKLNDPPEMNLGPCDFLTGACALDPSTACMDDSQCIIDPPAVDVGPCDFTYNGVCNNTYTTRCRDGKFDCPFPYSCVTAYGACLQASRHHANEDLCEWAVDPLHDRWYTQGGGTSDTAREIARLIDQSFSLMRNGHELDFRNTGDWPDRTLCVGVSGGPNCLQGMTRAVVGEVHGDGGPRSGTLSLWSEPRYVTDILPRRGAGFLRFVLKGAKLQPAGVPDQTECGGHPSVAELDLSLDADPNGTDQAEIKVLTDTLIAAFIEEKRVQVRTELTECSIGDRFLVKDIRFAPPPLPIECPRGEHVPHPEFPKSYTATSKDGCNATIPDTTVTGYTCKTGVHRDPRCNGVIVNPTCDVAIDGDTISILDPGGMGDRIEWTVRAADSCGNTGDALCSVEVASADLRVSTLCPAGPVTAGSEITYQIRYTNVGSGTGYRVRLFNQLPEGTTLVTSSKPICANSRDGRDISFCPGNCSEPANCRGDIDPNHQGIIQVTVRVDATAGDLQNAVFIHNMISLCNPGHSDDSDTCIMQAVAPDLSVTKRGPGMAIQGRRTAFEATVSNVGTAPAQDVALVDRFNPRFLDCSSIKFETSGVCTADCSRGRLTCDLGTIHPDEAESVFMSATVLTDQGVSGMIDNCADTSTSTPEISYDNNNVCIQVPVQGSAGTSAPSLAIDLLIVSHSPAGPVLHFSDSNPPDSVTGYNIYRVSDRSVQVQAWPLLAQDVTDADPALPNIQWADISGDVSPTGIWYYRVTAYNAATSEEGPF